MLAARGLCFSRNGHGIVSGVDISVGVGELVAVIGPNGAGKSTLCALLAGDLAPEAGKVLIDGRDLRSFSAIELARKRSVLLQNTALRFPFRAREIVMFGRHPYVPLWKSPSPGDCAAVESAMKETSVAEFADRLYPTLSGGEQRRVALARVLAQQTPLLLLDEPTSALDIGHQEEVMAVCRSLASAGRAVLAIVHDLNLAAAYADRVGVMKDGRMAAFGAPADVLVSGLLREVFGHPLLVLKHPDTGRPVVLTRPRQASEASRVSRD